MARAKSILMSQAQGHPYASNGFHVRPQPFDRGKSRVCGAIAPEGRCANFP